MQPSEQPSIQPSTQPSIQPTRRPTAVTVTFTVHVGKAADSAPSRTDLPLCDGTAPSSCNLRTAWEYSLAYIYGLACPLRILATIFLDDQLTAQVQSSTWGSLVLPSLFLTWASVCEETAMLVTIRGGAQSVVSGDGGTGSLFRITGPPQLVFKLQDLTVMGFGTTAVPRGGAVYVSSILATLVFNVQFINNRAARGGAVYATATTVNMTHSNFTSNQVSENQNALNASFFLYSSQLLTTPLLFSHPSP